MKRKLIRFIFVVVLLVLGATTVVLGRGSARLACSETCNPDDPTCELCKTKGPSNEGPTFDFENTIVMAVPPDGQEDMNLTGGYVTSMNFAGLGDEGEDAMASATYDADLVRICFNKGGNDPDPWQGLVKQTVEVELTPNRNGSWSGQEEYGAITGPACPNGNWYSLTYLLFNSITVDLEIGGQSTSWTLECTRDNDTDGTPDEIVPGIEDPSTSVSCRCSNPNQCSAESNQ